MLRLTLDENLPTGLVSVLAALGHDVDTVPAKRITGRDDAVVWQAAQDGQRLLVTQDLDFSDVRKFKPGSHHGLLLVRLPQPGRTALFERVVALFEVEDVDGWKGCVITAAPHRVRVRRPPSDAGGEPLR